MRRISQKLRHDDVTDSDVVSFDVTNNEIPQNMDIELYTDGYGDGDSDRASITVDHPVKEPLHDNHHSIGWSVVLLNIVAILWGTQHAVIKGVVDASFDPNSTATATATATATTDSPTTMMIPAVFTLLRFTIAALIASPYTTPFSNNDFHQVTSTTTTSDVANNEIPYCRTNRIWRWGIEMGLYMFLGFSLQAIGLQSTTAQRSGFLLYLNVKFVPFLAYLLYLRPIRTVTFVSALTAFTGTALLAYSPNDEYSTLSSDTTTTTFQHLSHMISLNTGDLWTMAAAVASAMFILRLEAASNELGQYEDAATANFNAASLWVVAFLSLLWVLFVAISESASSSLTLSSLDMLTLSNAWITIRNEMEYLLHDHVWELIYLGGVTTAFANYVQTRAQRYISAERASIIYAMDPVYGAFFSYLLLGETLNGITGYIGAAFIVVAAATNAFLDTTTK
jgi:drug/metabolite transporter (DMT)-like permease